jgi:hypothetical protein
LFAGIIIILPDVNVIVDYGVFCRSAGSLGHFLSNKVEIPQFCGNRFIADYGSGRRVGEPALGWHEKSFVYFFLDYYFHEVYFQVAFGFFGKFLEIELDLLYFVV